MSVHQLKDGRWICRHPKGKDPERPEAIARYFGRDEAGRQAAHAFNDALGFTTRQGCAKQHSPSFAELVNAYTLARKDTLARSSFENFCIKMEKIILPEIGDTMAHAITPTRLDAYVSARAMSVKLTTIHRELSDIRAVLRWAVSRHLISSNPMEWFAMPKRDDARIQPPTKAEFDAILACAVPHLKRAMLISYHTGLRPGKEELLCLTWEAVDFIGKTLMVISADKGGLPVRMVPLNKIILAHLQLWYDEDEKKGMRYLVHYNGGKVDKVEKAWLAAKRRARVTRRLRMYDLRHAFITTLLERGADLKSVSEIAGHASPDMTMTIYQHVSSELKRKAVELLE